MLSSRYKYLDNCILSYINQIIKDPSINFDEERFKLWLDNNEIESKANPSAFVKSCFVKELKRGTFSKAREDHILYIPNVTPMLNELRKNDVLVTAESTTTISIINEWLVQHGIVTNEEMTFLNHGIVKYIIENKLTCDDYPELLRKSNSLKGKMVDWQEIGQKINKARQEWESLMIL